MVLKNRDSNTNVRFNQRETLERIFKRLEASEVYISRARMDCSSCSEEIVDMVEAHCKHFYIRATRCSSFYDSMFALTGWKTVEINGIGWNRLPKSFMAQNTVFLLMTALFRNLYKAIMQRLKTHEFGLCATSRIKTFVFKFISVPAKWIKTSRRHILKIYSDNNAYANLFQTDFG